MIFFAAPDINKEIIEKYIFKLTNKALGEAANSMNESDIKIIDLGAKKSDTVV